MPSYPSATTLPRKTSVVPLNSAIADRSDAGLVRIASLAAVQAYGVEITHPLVTQSQLDELMGFWAAYKDQSVSVVRADSMIYECPFVDAPEIDDVNGSRFNAKVKLQGRRIPSYVPAGYGHFETSPTVTISAGAATASWDTTVKRFGDRSLKITKDTTDSVATSIHLAPSATTYNAAIPANSKWLLIVSLRQSALRNLTLAMRASDSTYYSAGSAYTPAAVDTWYRFARIIDATAAAQTAAHFRLLWQSTAAAGDTLNIDAVTAILLTNIDTEVTESAFPTTYIPPEP